MASGSLPKEDANLLVFLSERQAWGLLYSDGT